jgi:hypothetical protein
VLVVCQEVSQEVDSQELEVLELELEPKMLELKILIDEFLTYNRPFL